MTDAEVEGLAAVVSDRLGRPFEVKPPPNLDDVELRPPRISPPSSLASICSETAFDRALHTYGRAYRDVVRAFHRELPHPPDVVAFPTNEADVTAVLDWCSDAGAAAIPFGGGSSVVGGVEYRGDDRPVVSLDLTGMHRVLDIDRTSRAARIEGGALGPVLEDQLRPHGLTLRHFPQSFEVSTLGGWLATRSGGHYATVYTHIDDLTESIRAITPTGVWESRRLPGSGAGPSPDRMLLGSEGSLGVITEAWMRVQDRPRWRASAGVRFERFEDGVEAARAVSQAALFPTNCRLLDGIEAGHQAGAGEVGALLVLGFESADHPVQAWIDRAVELCRDHKGEIPDGIRISGPEDNEQSREGSVGEWRKSFVRAPYTRDGLVRCAVIVDTFETACTWAAFGDLYAAAKSSVERALQDICGGGWVTCRFTHVYPDGPAPYFSIIAPTRFGSEVAMWDEVKAAAADALLASGGTITHHHAVGRDHDPWYRQQRPEPLGRALQAVKREVDPAGVMNPGVIC